jgi:hypothetical protein
VFRALAKMAMCGRPRCAVVFVVSVPEELSEVEKARYRAARSASAEVRSALDSGDSDETAAALGQFMQALSGLDPESTRDKLHVPEDAGQHRDALVTMLLRIPDNWGRWISCDAGWYPIIVELDRQLAAIDPNYELRQVKEKFGGLRYYFRASDPKFGKAMRALVDEAETHCETTCETCGKPGALHTGRHSWLKTLCAACAAAGGFGLVGELVDELTADMCGVWKVSAGADSFWDLTRGEVHFGDEALGDGQVLVPPRVLGTFRLRLADGSEMTSELITAIERIR